MADLQSRPYQPDESQCCEACVFGRGEHAEWCSLRLTLEQFTAIRAEAAARLVVPKSATTGKSLVGLTIPPREGAR